MEKTNNYLFAAIFFIVLGTLTIVAITFHFVFAGHKYSEYGTLGDAIGGITNPIIAIGAAILTFAAFYIQYQANKQVQDQFKVQQFESQFYEMLRLHKDNINEMKIEGYFFNTKKNTLLNKEKDKQQKTTTGRKVFVTMNTELNSCYFLTKKILRKKGIRDLKVVFDYSYYIFFLGLDDFERNLKNFSINDKIDIKTLDFLHKELRKARKKHGKGVKNYRNITLNFNYKPFCGHQSRLAHYYRHLYTMVKFVVCEDESLLPYEKKRNYLRILRAQLSNYEQVLLYYNWLSDFGYSWEEKNIEKRKNKEGNYFFTDYRMIHNTPPNLVISDFELDDVFDDKFRYFRFEKDRKNEDLLFELIKIKSLRDN